MNYALVDSLMQEFEHNNSLKIPEDLKKEVRIIMYTSQEGCNLIYKWSLVSHWFKVR